MTETEASDKPAFAQRAAKLSWQLFIVTLVLVVLSRRVPGALLIMESLGFLTMAAGALCAIIALIGMLRSGTEKVLLPALAGFILNGLLVFIFVTNFVTARQKALQVRTAQVHARTSAPVQSAAAPANAHIGSWEARFSGGEMVTWTFTAEEFSIITPKGKGVPLPYEIDYSRQPAWLTVHCDKYGKPPMLMIVEFTSDGSMRVLGPATSSGGRRPVDFSANPADVVTFRKLR